MNNGKFRIRKLIDGNYVAEKSCGLLFKKWKGIDIRACGFLWDVGGNYYKDCIGTYDECKRALAWHGVEVIQVN